MRRFRVPSPQIAAEAPKAPSDPQIILNIVHHPWACRSCPRKTSTRQKYNSPGGVRIQITTSFLVDLSWLAGRWERQIVEYSNSNAPLKLWKSAIVKVAAHLSSGLYSPKRIRLNSYDKDFTRICIDNARKFPDEFCHRSTSLPPP